MLSVEAMSRENWLTIISFILLIIVFFLLFLFVFWLVRQVIANERAFAKKQEENLHESSVPRVGRVFTDGGRSFCKKSK